MSNGPEKTTEEIMTMVHIHTRIDEFIEDSVTSMRTRSFVMHGAHLLRGIAKGTVHLTIDEDSELSPWITNTPQIDDHAAADAIANIGRLLLLAHWTALETFVEDILEVLQPSRSARDRIKDTVRERLANDNDHAKGVTAWEAWFTELGYSSNLTADHEQLLRQVAQLRNAIAHGGTRPTTRYVAKAPKSWALSTDRTLVIPDPALGAALNAIALYVAYLGARLTGAAHSLTVPEPHELIHDYNHPFD